MGLPLREREGERQGLEDALVSVSDWTNSQFACVYIHLRICLCVYSPQDLPVCIFTSGDNCYW